jgi:hypothetical protein
MTRAEHQVIPADGWQRLFDERRASLSAIAEVLLSCRVPSEQILDSAMASLTGSPMREPFGPLAAIRAVVKAAIAQNREAADSRPTCSRAEAQLQEPIEHRPSETCSFGSSPWLERAVYLLRELLMYSRRDTALLLSVSDVNVDQLHEFAKKRPGNWTAISAPSLLSDVSDMSRPDELERAKSGFPGWTA